MAEPHLIKGLYSHLSTSGLPKYAGLVGEAGELSNLALKAGQYSQVLIELLKLISEEIAKSGEKVNFNNEGQPGLTRWFILTLWNDAIQKAGGYSWINSSWYKNPENITGTRLVKLDCGGNTIGIAKTQKNLKMYENWHKILRINYSKHPLAKDLYVRNQEINNLGQDIRNRFQEFSDIEYLPGACELC